MHGANHHFSWNRIDRRFAHLELKTRLRHNADSFTAVKYDLTLIISPHPGEYPRAMGLVWIVASIFNHIRSNNPVCFFRGCDQSGTARYCRLSGSVTLTSGGVSLQTSFKRAALTAAVAQVPVVYPRRKPFSASFFRSKRKEKAFSGFASEPIMRSVPWFASRISIAFTTAAAHGDPPRVPRLVIRGTHRQRLSFSLLCSVPTNPTGSPMIRCGRHRCALTRRIASSRAVGASPIARIRLFPNCAQARLIPAADRVIPYASAMSLVSSS